MPPPRGRRTCCGGSECTRDHEHRARVDRGQCAASAIARSGPHAAAQAVRDVQAVCGAVTSLLCQPAGPPGVRPLGRRHLRVVHRLVRQVHTPQLRRNHTRSAVARRCGTAPPFCDPSANATAERMRRSCRASEGLSRQAPCLQCACSVELGNPEQRPPMAAGELTALRGLGGGASNSPNTSWRPATMTPPAVGAAA